MANTYSIEAIEKAWNDASRTDNFHDCWNFEDLVTELKKLEWEEVREGQVCIFNFGGRSECPDYVTFTDRQVLPFKWGEIENTTYRPLNQAEVGTGWHDDTYRQWAVDTLKTIAKSDWADAHSSIWASTALKEHGITGE